MTPGKLRTVFDCNIFFQALISPRGPSAKCVNLALDRTILLFCSTYIIEELRDAASDPTARSKFGIDEDRLILLIDNIRSVAAFIDDAPEVFVYPRDPSDAHYINLAQAANAAYVVSRDNDLLDLMDPLRPEARDFQMRFPHLRIIEPQTLIREVEQQPS